MKTVSTNFKTALKSIREFDTKLTLKTPLFSDGLLAENGNVLIAETGTNIELGTEIGTIELTSSEIIRVNPVFSTELYKTVLRSVEIETTTIIPKNSEFNLKIGLMVNGSYEYVDYGNYYVKEEPTYQADTNSYIAVGYDKMADSMVKYDVTPLTTFFPITCRNLLIRICNLFGWRYNFTTLTNGDVVIPQDLFINQELTFRDVLDNLSQVMATNLMFENDVLINKEISNTYLDVINEENLKNINVDIKEKYGVVNRLIITADKNTLLAEVKDASSIATNGETKYQIDDNLILLNNQASYINGIFNKIKGLSYYTFDFDTIGLLIYDPLDRINVNIDGEIYSTIILYDDIKLTTGLTETILAEAPEMQDDELISTGSDEKNQNKTNKKINEANAKINNANVEINKANAQIVLKVDSNGKISKVELNGDADKGQNITIATDQLELNATDVINLIAGHTINFTSDNITIDSTKFKLTADGKCTANEFSSNKATITGGSITLVGDEAGTSKPKLKVTGLGSDRRSTDMNTAIYSDGILISKNLGQRGRIVCNDDVAYLSLHTGNVDGDWGEYATDSWLIRSSDGLQTDCDAGHQPLTSSDIRLKENIENINEEKSMSIITNLTPVTYNFIKQEDVHRGLIAQDVIKVLNENGVNDQVYKTEETGYYSLSYGELIPDLINCIKYQQKEIEELKRKVEK